MNKFEIESKLNELKDCSKIRILVNNEPVIDYNYSEIINNPITEFILIPSHSKFYPYCAINDIVGD